MKKLSKKTLTALIAAAVIIIFGLIFLLLHNSEDRKNITEGSVTKPAVPDNVVTITFAIPDLFRIDDEKLSLLNDEFIKDGLNYRLDIKYLEYENYSETLAAAAESGSIDVAFMGLGEQDGANNVYKLLRSGLFCNLDDILQSDTGKVLYDSFPKALWESVKCDKHYYSIPAALVNDRGICVAFNRDYVTDEAIEAWSGDLEGLYKILQDVSYDSEDSYSFVYFLDEYSFGKMIGCEINYGLLYDYETQTVDNPLESEKFMGFLKTLDAMKNEGYLNPSMSCMNIAASDGGANIEAGNYAIALYGESTDEQLLKDNICVKRIPGVLSSRINASIGIACTVKDINAVVDFLGRLYSSEKYGNILAYGIENKDYKIVDGLAASVNDVELSDNFYTKLGMDLFINVAPVSGEAFIENRREEYFSYYEGLDKSPFIGFEPDTEKLGNISADLYDFMDSLSGQSVDEALPAAKKRIQADGMDEYLESVRRQWEEFK